VNTCLFRIQNSNVRPRKNLSWVFFLGFALCILPCHPSAAAQPARSEPIEVDPIRCWWRTSAGAVAVGQPFAATLTCAVVETSSVRVVPDESQLAVETIQLAPFELIGGNHAPDLRSGARRFFQYEYQLRIIDPSAIGKDASLPRLTIHYRVESQVQSQASEGRDLTYLMPPVAVRVLSLVPADATDIRDASSEPFGAIDALRFRARMLDIGAATLAALGVVVLVAAIVGLVVAPRRRLAGGSPRLSDHAVLGAVTSELTAVQNASRAGWTPALLNRALAAIRVAGAYAIGRQVPHRAVPFDVEEGDGRVLVARGIIRRRRSAVTSPVTAADIKRELDRLPLTASHERRTRLEVLHESLLALTRAQYAPTPVEPTGDSIGAALQIAEQLRREHGWLARLTPSPAK
jgi:hypothetical protein